MNNKTDIETLSIGSAIKLIVFKINISLKGGSPLNSPINLEWIYNEPNTNIELNSVATSVKRTNFHNFGLFLCLILGKQNTKQPQLKGAKQLKRQGFGIKTSQEALKL